MKAFTCTLVAILAMVWPSAAAVALDLTFDDVMSVGNPLVTMLDTHGYRFTGSFRTIDTPGGLLVSNGSAVYLGQEASGPGITVTRADGGRSSSTSSTPRAFTSHPPRARPMRSR